LSKVTQQGQERREQTVPEAIGVSPTALAEFLVQLERQGLIHINRRKLKLS
jgi:DNA-binding GntR family transcriptional regulator